ncbi:MAG: large terminase subunit, partial [Actinobacteria bacterium]
MTAAPNVGAHKDHVVTRGGPLVASALDETTVLTDRQWLAQEIGSLTDEKIILKVSEWAEQKRYLPPALTAKPGHWDNSYTPYLTEIMDCLSANHPCRKLAVQKAAQIGATTGILENFVGYVVDHNPAGVIYITADKDLAKIAIELKVDRMLETSGLLHKLGAPVAGSRRTGNTGTMKEFPGGFLLGFGANNPGKLRSTPAPFMLLDEVDGMPDVLGGVGREEGSILGLVEARTRTYEKTRKILYISTPLILQTSKINKLFRQGDQRYYLIPCIQCGHFQELIWRKERDDGTFYGIQYEITKTGRLIADSVRYECVECRGHMKDYHKSQFLTQGRWEATAEPEEDFFYSYHLSAFVSPVFSWEGAVRDWFKAWDPQRDRVKSIDQYQTFRNLVQGLPWEERGEAPTFDRVVAHRRPRYESGNVPNEMSVAETGSPVAVLTCAADCHKDRIDVEVVGWCKDRQTYSVEWLHFEGDTDTPDPWNEMADLIENRTWRADDGREYMIGVTLIDSGYRAEAVHSFTANYE